MFFQMQKIAKKMYTEVIGQIVKCKCVIQSHTYFPSINVVSATFLITV